MQLNKVDWSKSLKSIVPRVERILYKGNIKLLLNESPKLAIVGSRRMSEYGERVIDKWMPSLVEKGVTIVSGFMYGVDQAAHKACLENGGNTIAVLGWGIDMKVTAEDEKLYQKILEVNSLIVSEYEGEMEGSLWSFPQRNRIVAGVSDAVLVVEAAERSGSLITARLATTFGKPLMAVPGLVTSKLSEGTNNLIKTGKAVMVTSAEDVLKVMNLSIGQMKLNMKDSHIDPVLKLLESGERGADEIGRLLKMTTSEVSVKLVELSLSGLIEEKRGKFKLVL